jgi:hypothetical protein
MTTGTKQGGPSGTDTASAIYRLPQGRGRIYHELPAPWRPEKSKRAGAYKENKMKLENITTWFKKRRKRKGKKKRFEIGDRISCKGWNDLLAAALMLSSEGYKIEIESLIGSRDIMDMTEIILKITALPENND